MDLLILLLSATAKTGVFVTGWVLGLSLVCCILLIVPQMDIRSPGSGIMAKAAGEVVSVTESEIVVQPKKGDPRSYLIKRKEGELVSEEERTKSLLVLPRSMSWQETSVQVGQQVEKKELLARGVTQIFFQANILGVHRSQHDHRRRHGNWQSRRL